MAHAQWAHSDKSSGSGNDNVGWTADARTGRNSRTTQATFSASGVSPVTLIINQAGKAEFVEMDDNATLLKTGGTVTISGKSNSSKLNFTLTGNNDIGLVLPATYIAHSVNTNNNTAITGDPGGEEEYNFSITFANVSANPGVTSRTSQLTVTDNAGHTDTCIITQAAGDATLSISPTTINLDAAGTLVNVAVTSNTSWSIS